LAGLEVNVCCSRYRKGTEIRFKHMASFQTSSTEGAEINDPITGFDER
jgi:hypothetical protein